MKRVQVYIEEELDKALHMEAAKSGRSKAALIRECLESRYSADPESLANDPLTALVGSVDAEPGSIDEVVYER